MLYYLLVQLRTILILYRKTYLIFYEINKDSIEILSFWDNRQDEFKEKI